MALDFTLAAGSASPFGDLVAVLGEVDGSTGIYEAYGPSGCTYEPASNTGIVIVRHLVDTGLPQPNQYQIYSLVDSGIMP